MIFTQHSVCLFSSSFVFVFFFFLLMAFSIDYQKLSNSNMNNIIDVAIAVAQIPDNLTLSNLISQGLPYQGNLSSSLVIIDFSDFQCYLCKRYVYNTEQQVNSSYIQPGKAVYVFKHLPNRGFDSKNASIAAQCTNDQGKFWEFHKILYANQGPIDSGWANTENLKKFASQIPDINTTEFNSCFNTKKYESLVDKDVTLANSLGFTETPSFLIMNSEGSIVEKIQGPKPFPIFKSVIDNLEGKIDKN